MWTEDRDSRCRAVRERGPGDPGTPSSLGLHGSRSSGQTRAWGPALEAGGPWAVMGTTNLTRGRGCLHGARHRRDGVKVQVQQTGLLRERPRGLKLGSSGSRGGRQLVRSPEPWLLVQIAGAQTHHPRLQLPTHTHACAAAVPMSTQTPVSTPDIQQQAAVWMPPYKTSARAGSPRPVFRLRPQGAYTLLSAPQAS